MKPVLCFATTICIVVILIFTNFVCVNSSRILAVEFIGAKSHVLTYLPLLEELSKRGHEVTLLSPLKTTGHRGIREILTVNIESLEKLLEFNIYEMKEKELRINMFKSVTEIAPKFCAELYEREDIKAVMEETFDLVILQPFFNECAMGFVHKVTQRNKVPLILFTPMSAPAWIVECTGGHHPPSFIPSFVSHFRDEMTFWERMKNFGIEMYFHYIHSFYCLPLMEGVYRDKMGKDFPSVKEILGTTSIILSNGHFSISRPKPNLPDVIDVGGIHSRPAQPLSKHFQNFIEKSGEDGFILFSFGSRFRGDWMPERKRRILLNVFGKLKQGVIWKYESEIGNVPENVMLSKWLPQQDLLGHPSIKMFITHCGLGGIEESIYHGTPLLGIPMLPEQTRNAIEAERHGILLQLDWNHLTEEILLNAINTLLDNPSYKRSAMELSSVFKDQIDSPLERAVWWTEYVLRHNGAPRLQSPARKLNFIQYHSLDVLTAYLLVLTFAAYASWKMIISLLTFRSDISPSTQGAKKKRS